MTRVIDFDTALALLRKQVEAKGPDYIYLDHFPGCYLTYPTAQMPVPTAPPRPACIVGHVYADLGVPLGVLYRIRGVVGEEFYSPSGSYDPALVPLDGDQLVDWAELGLEFTPEALRLLGRAQIHQDMGSSWGEAVAQAEYEVTRIREMGWEW